MPSSILLRRDHLIRRIHLIALFVAVLVAGACRGAKDDLRTERRVKLPEAVAKEASLRVDGRGRVWVVEPGRATVVDTGRAPRLSRIAVGAGTRLPAPEWDPAGRLYVDRGGEALAALGRDPSTLPRALRQPGPVARDPRGRWVYAGVRNGGVVGFTADSLRPAWGWPEAGPRAGALAVGPLGDRVYLALDADEREERAPRIEIRDAQTGRALGTQEQQQPVRALAATGDGDLLGLAEEEDGAGSVFALRHGPGGLSTLWRVSLGRLGITAPARLRVSPDGRRAAVFPAAGGEGGLRVLDAATGRAVGQTREAPLDAAFDAAGRLHLLSAREVRTVP